MTTILAVVLYLSAPVAIAALFMAVYVLTGGEWKELLEYPIPLTILAALIWLIAWPFIASFVVLILISGDLHT